MEDLVCRSWVAELQPVEEDEHQLSLRLPEECVVALEGVGDSSLTRCCQDESVHER